MLSGLTGLKKKASEEMTQMTDDQTNAMRLEPTQRVNLGLKPPHIMHVTSPKAISTV